MAYNIYIGFDSSNYGQQLAFDVCKRSILKMCSDPSKINIIQLRLLGGHIYTITRYKSAKKRITNEITFVVNPLIV